MEFSLKLGVLVSLVLHVSLLLILVRDSHASPELTILAHEEDILEPSGPDRERKQQVNDGEVEDAQEKGEGRASEIFSYSHPPFETRQEGVVAVTTTSENSVNRDSATEANRVEDQNTNPPFPSQSSSFWLKEDEGGRDYETPPTDTITETKTKDETRKRGSAFRGAQGEDERPNIILIITDDQDIELGSMEYMPETLKIFRESGTEFRHGYVSTPICCPSRSSMLTGMYVHNHEVFTNNDNCSSINWREKYEKKTFASYLWSSGYYTSYIGKYLNKYDGSHIPHGWDEWNGLLMNSRYYNYTLNRNGRRFRYGNDLERDYYPDSIARDGLDFLDRVASDPSKQPFLLVLSFPSPHGPEDSAPKYSNLFLNATPHHTPSYNYAPNTDKQWILRVTDKMTPMLKEFTNLLMTKRLQTLQSVDVAVRDIFHKLESHRMRDSTYAFYTSDHGYHVGQFGLVKGKSMPYEFDIRVPFFLAGPRDIVEGGTVIREPVLNIDFAPTFLELASLPIPEEMDGRSMVPLIKKYCPTCPKEENFEWPDVFLIESPGRRSPPSSSSSGSGSGEAFDKHQNPKKVRRKHREKLIFDDDEVLSLTHLCAMHPHPCMPGQKKYCRKEKNRIRFRKCRQNVDFLLSSRVASHDPRINDPLYGHNNNVSSLPDVSNQRCSCRFKRSTSDTAQLERILEAGADDDGDLLDWETERKRIDDEIEKLKQRIEYLRQRRKEIRRKWLAENYPSGRPPLPGRRPTILGPHSPRRKGERKGKGRGQKNDTGIIMDELEEGEAAAKEQDYDISSESEEKDDDDGDDLEDGDEDEDSMEYENENRESNKEDNNYREGRRRVEEKNERNEFNESFKEGSEVPVIDGDKLEMDVTTSAYEGFSSGPVKKPGLILEGENDDGDDDDEEEFDEEDDKEEDEERVIMSSSTSTSTTSTTTTTTTTSSTSTSTSTRGTTRKPNRHHDHRGGRNKHQNGRNKLKGIYLFNKHSSLQPGNTNNNNNNNNGNGEDSGNCNCYNDPRWLRQREREDRKHRKILSKLRKKQRIFKRIEDPVERQQAETCGKEEKMNCFWHDSDHWRTAPFWTSGSFCFCMNANNNSYSCLRSVNTTHNYLYCQFVTGFKMYFDLMQDPYQLKNTIDTLPASSEDWIMARLYKLKQCKGRDECWSDDSTSEDTIHPSLWEQIFGRWPKKRRRGDGSGGGGRGAGGGGRRRKYHDMN